MSVLYLTIFVSVALVVIFLVGFLYHCLRGSGDPLRDSLLPFQKDLMKPTTRDSRSSGGPTTRPNRR